MRFALVFLFNLLAMFHLAFGADAAVRCEGVASEIKGWSSSFHARAKGEMFFKKAVRNQSPPISVDSKIWQMGHGTTLIERLDAIRLQNGKATIGEKLKSDPTYYNPKATSFGGLCNLWAAAAMNPQTNDFLKGLKAFVCGNVVLTRGDVKELFTALSFHSLDVSLGQREEGKHGPLGKGLVQILDQLGLDDLDPDKLYGTVSQILPQKSQTAVLEVSWGPEVWNQPVTSIQRCRSPLSLKNTRALTKLPLYVWESINPEIERELMLFRQAEKTLRTRLDFEKIILQHLTDQKLEEIATEILKAIVTPSDLESSQISRLQTFLNLREHLYKKISMSLQKSETRIRSQYQIEQVDLRISYLIGSSFGDSRDLPPRHRSLQYFRIQDGSSGGQIDSVWISPPQKRPDYFWAATKMQIGPGVTQLMGMLDQCQRLQ